MLRLASLAAGLAALAVAAAPAFAQTEFTQKEGNLKPRPVAVTPFLGDDEREIQVGKDIAGVISNNLAGTALFSVTDPASFIEKVADIDVVPRFADWRLIGADWLVTGRVDFDETGKLRVAFRLWDVNSQVQKTGLRFETAADNWRRVSHQISDKIYTAVTADSGYFDTRVVFIAESGQKSNPTTRLAIMDQDGVNPRFLTSGAYLVLLPNFSPSSQQIIYVSYRDGRPRTYLFDIETGREEALFEISQDSESYSARFSPDGNTVVTTVATRGNSDIHTYDLRNRRFTRLTTEPSIDTEPTFDPAGRRIAFTSNRSGERERQLYVMNADGSDVRRITRGEGKYGTPAWSPRGDLIAFTKQLEGEFHLGVVKVDGTGERLITRAFKIDRPTWSPNGRVIMFTAEQPGATLQKEIRSIDLMGTGERKVPTPNAASDPAWSPLLE